ncbi:ABC transporter permease [Ramlibacter sp. AW1]|uniref:ABC transporter permease n=1 Tax=Ramlibacter aurantiacus TaxID=2801330 RepID=A0A936ZZL1_9BURK|nr:ABC transporter permease [Ramlibacter aurantiacus]MBL0423359.1 ABC transporter permease [Ramlibacter aurantiacus]
MKKSHAWIERAAALGFAASVLLLWQLLAATEFISPLFFPSPGRTLSELWAQASDGRLWAPLLASTQRMVLGWLVASLLGVVAGALIASSRTVHQLFNPLLEFLRPLPAAAVIPVAILAFGLSDRMSTAVIAFGSIWPVLLASVHGFSAVDERLHEVSRALRMPMVARFWKVALPSALPDILAGARVGLAVALILAVVTEMQASLPGIGQNLLMAQRAFRTPELYAGVVVLGLLGFVASALLTGIERRMLRWRERP